MSKDAANRKRQGQLRPVVTVSVSSPGQSRSARCGMPDVSCGFPLAPLASRRRPREAELPHALVEGGAGDAESAGGSVRPPSPRARGPLARDGARRRREGSTRAASSLARRPAAGGCGAAPAKSSRLERGVLGEQRRVLEHVAQLADVAGPGVREKSLAPRPPRGARRAVRGRPRSASRNSRASRITSSPRSRSGGTRSSTAADPVVEVLAERAPPAPWRSRSRCVAAISRTSTRRSLDVAQAPEAHAPRAPSAASPGPARSTSPISSRNSVPRCAISSSPGLAATAPVKAPFSCPKSSLSSSSRERPAQFRSTNGCCRARSVVVQPAGEHALAAAGLALDEHGRRARRRRGPPARQSRRTTALSPRNGSGATAVRPAAARPRSPGAAAAPRMSRSTITQQRRAARRAWSGSSRRPP